MYITLDNEVFEIPKMTISFLKNALLRYNALCIATNITQEERDKRKQVKKLIEAELAERRKLRFVPVTD